VGFDPESRVLEIEFRQRGVYRYYQVPWSVYEDLVLSDSKGKFFDEHIRNIYPSRFAA
jgi:hypothetical protein